MSVRLEYIEGHYGSGVSAILRAGDYPTEPSSWFVQHQELTSEKLSRWITDAVFDSPDAAQQATERWSSGERKVVIHDSVTGKQKPTEQPISTWRALSLFDLMAEGRESLYSAFLDLVTSDHEWLISTEVGSEQKIGIYAEQLRRMDEDVA
jgi:hypothetical protein